MENDKPYLKPGALCHPISRGIIRDEESGFVIYDSFRTKEENDSAKSTMDKIDQERNNTAFLNLLK